VRRGAVGNPSVVDGELESPELINGPIVLVVYPSHSLKSPFEVVSVQCFDEADSELPPPTSNGDFNE
jgi:hypothetical protein